MSRYFNEQNTNELYHHGVKGMKWGVRRYQNTDGSYTAEGLKRFNKSLDAYESTKKKYDSAKANGNKLLAKQYKVNLKIAKQNLNKNYKQLKYDKKADKGKDIYKTGYRITGNRPLQQLTKAGGTIAAGLAAANNLGIMHVSTKDLLKLEAGVAAVSIGSSILDYTVYGRKDNNLRAYYSHSRTADTPLNRVSDNFNNIKNVG